MKKLGLKLKESLFAVFPISATVIVLVLTPLAKMDSTAILGFIIASVLLIFGMGLFTLGVDIAMMPMAEMMGASLTRTKKLKLIIPITFFIGFMIAFAEPGLNVLGQQLSAIVNPWLLITAVGVGVGFFMVMAMIKTIFQINFKLILLVSYGILFALAIALQLAGKSTFLAFAFDGGGAVTGAITVPFVMAFGIGIAAIKADDESSDGFGYITLCVIGAIISILLLGAIVPLDNLDIPIDNSALEFADFFRQIPVNMVDVAVPIGLVLALFVVFQLTLIKMPKKSLIRMLFGILYTYVGLVIFMTGANVGFIPVGRELGSLIGGGDYSWLLVPVGVLVGFLIVLAEPGIRILGAQVEEVSGGTIRKNAMLLTLMIGIGTAIGLAMVRVLTGISIWWILAPGYLIALGLTFIVPKVYTSIAFDSGGVASGLMAASFLVPFALGATNAVGGNILTDAFGLIAFVSMIPLIAVQLMGLAVLLKTKRSAKKLVHIEPDDYEIVELD